MKKSNGNRKFVQITCFILLFAMLFTGLASAFAYLF